MLMSSEEINLLLNLAGDSVTKAGKKYFEQERVTIKGIEYINENNYKILVCIKDENDELFYANINKRNGVISHHCTCKHDSILNCKHLVAAYFDIYINPDKYINLVEDKRIASQDVQNPNIVSVADLQYNEKDEPEDLSTNSEYKVTPADFNNIYITNKLIRYYDNIEENDVTFNSNISIIPYFIVDSFTSHGDRIFVSFKLMSKRAYNIKNLHYFAVCIKNRRTYSYGKDLSFKHTLDAFDENSKYLANFIKSKVEEYEACVQYYNENAEYFEVYDRILLSGRTLDEMVKYALKLDYIELQEQIKSRDKKFKKQMIKIVDANPKLNFKVTKENGNLVIINDEIFDIKIFRGEEANYLLLKNTLYKCSKEFSEEVFPVIETFKSGLVVTDKISIPNKKSPIVYESVVTKLKDKVDLDIDEDVEKEYAVLNFGTKIYLDIHDDGTLVAKVKFCYENGEFNPFKIDENINIKRNIKREKKVIKIFEENRFLLNKKNGVIYLKDDEDIYNFLQNGINIFMQKFEVLVTDKFKKRNIVRPKNVTMGVRVSNNLLEIDLNDLGFNEEELENVFKSYKLKKKYYRLKDGSFIDLGSSGINTLANLSDNLDIGKDDIINGKIRIPKYRSIYLDNIIKNNENIKLSKDDLFKNIVNDMTRLEDTKFNLPVNLKVNLREYQKTGFNWLKLLDKYQFGGILADDMGLGKTLQVIAILQSEKENGKENKTSIVVCPSSLYINWQKEINKFAPKLKVAVVSGSVTKREQVISDINKYDVVLTSYDILKRDIEKYNNITFKYIIADEAQYIKNNNTQNAKALKLLNGDTKFALTGTPMENSLSELWSIFDFCMPGYLFSYKKFKENFELPIIKDEDKEARERLQKIVAPFILRRTKKEVLTELPDKTETHMYNEMNELQEKVYKSYLLEAKKEMETEIKENGFEKSRMKILSVITRLRQICCHPSLFIDNYEGESSKLNQCMQIVEDAIFAGHKLLIFSQFTSMFDIISKELEKRNIKFYMLTGKTDIVTRVDLVEKFNASNDISVFLVSLKAGGTGLNLIGADMVIHYDPWWNLSVQNQATDRAYRIGQKSNVQVFKLITQNTIEEKIQKLQESKQELTDSIVKSGETFINKISKEELLSLFE